LVLLLSKQQKSYGIKTHYTDSQNRDTTASGGRQLYHLQFPLQAASPKTFGYTHIYALGSIKHELKCVKLTGLMRQYSDQVFEASEEESGVQDVIHYTR
jgi:hypothetical protein